MAKRRQLWRAVRSDGLVYEGERNAKGQPHGLGTVTYPDGRSYTGGAATGTSTDRTPAEAGGRLPPCRRVAGRRCRASSGTGTTSRGLRPRPSPAHSGEADHPFRDEADHHSERSDAGR